MQVLLIKLNKYYYYESSKFHTSIYELKIILLIAQNSKEKFSYRRTSNHSDRILEQESFLQFSRRFATKKRELMKHQTETMLPSIKHPRFILPSKVICHL